MRKTKRSVALSIIVCSYNGLERIEACIEALGRQSAAKQIEIIVVDDGSKDSVGFFARLALEKTGLQFQVIEFSSNQGLSAARNAGVAASSGEFVAFTDDDCRPGVRWAEDLIDSWGRAEKSVHGIGGPVSSYSVDSFNRRFLDASEPLHAIESGQMGRGAVAKIIGYLFPERISGVRKVDSFVGANMSFRRSSIDAVGGFDPAIRFGGDEQYLCIELRKRFGEESLHLDPAIVIEHEFHLDFKDTLRRAYQYGVGNGRSWKRHRGFPSVLPGVILTVMALLFGGAVHITLAPIAAALVIMLIGRRSLLVKPGRDSNASRLERVAYPFALMLSEVADNAGFISGALKHVEGLGAVVKKSDVARANSARSTKRSGAVTLVTPTLLWGVVAGLSSVFHTGWPGAAVAMASLVLIPGAVIVSNIGFSPRDITSRLVASVSVGLIFVMALGAVVSWIGPHIGVQRPLDRVPMLWVWGVVLGILIGASAVCKKDAYLWLRGESKGLSAGWGVFVLAIPGLAALFAARLNNGGSGAPAYILTVGVAATLLLLMAATWKRDRGIPVEAIVASVTLALVWSTTLRGYGLFGWDIQQELGVLNGTVAQGVWSIPVNGDAYASMLSLTSLPTQIHSLAGIETASVLRWVFPVLLAVLAAGVVAAARRRSAAGPAVLALSIVALGTASFARQIPAIGRQEVAFLLFGTIMLAVSASDVAVKARRSLALISGIGLAFSHYTSSYVTAAMLLLVIVLSPALTGRSRRGTRVLSLGVCVGIIAASGLWNGVITRPATELGNASATVSSSGLRFLDNSSDGPVAAWLNGTGPRLTSYKEYHKAIIENRDEAGWYVIDPRASSVQPKDASSPSISGAVAPLKGGWSLLNLLAKQGVTVGIILSLIWYFRRVVRREEDAPAELFVLGLGALIVSAVLRVSSTAGLLYNPERGAIHAALVFSIILAPFIGSLKRSFVIPAGMTVVLVITSWGLTIPVFGGTPVAAFSNIGEDVERYITTPADLGTSNWVATALPAGSLVHADRYGRVSLLAYETRSNFTIMDTVDPSGVDHNGYILFTSSNTRTGRVRGQVDTKFSVFESTQEFFEKTRSLVYSTEESRVYR